MKKIILLGILLSNFFGQAQYTLIPDVNFEKALIAQGHDSGSPDGMVFNSDINGITVLNVMNRNISDLTGVEGFTNLSLLACGTNQLTNLDISQNKNLRTLICSENKLTNIYFATNSKLEVIECNDNFFTNLDISKNTQLKLIDCSHNQLINLDTTSNSKLEKLFCSSNNLNSLDVSKNILLKELFCLNNQLTNLDVSSNTALELFHCDNNQLTSLNLKNGANTKLTSIFFGSNPQLNCIQVDNKGYSDVQWYLKKDTTTSFSENCSKKTGSIPPKITATGNQLYCQKNAMNSINSINIIPNVSITFDPSEPGTDAMYVQISSGYVFGNDQLTLRFPATHQAKNIFSDWDSATGKLKLYSPTGANILYSDFEAALKDVMFYNTEIQPSGTRTFSITIGQANYLPSTGHYYEYVPSLGISWTDAKVGAESRNYFGLQGYLATITTADEAQLTGKQSSGAGWLGGTDSASEGTWRWVTGPEGLTNGGQGTVFWTGQVNGTTPNFAFWNTNEPNQFQGREEDYVHITAPGVGITGAWNDLTINGEPTGSFQPKGYIVEYGGMPVDPTLQIAASTSITIPTKIEFEPASRCFKGSLILKPKDFSGAIRWHDVQTGGTVLKVSNTFTSPSLTATTSYYADPYDGTCPLSSSYSRIEVQAKIISPSVSLPPTTPKEICGKGTTTLTAIGSTDSVLKWYDVPVGGTSLQTGSNFTTANLITNTTFYVDATEGTCVSARTAITAKVLTVPTITSNTPATRCDTGSVTLNAIASAGSLNWYEKDAGGTSVGTGSPFTTPSLTITTTFYVDATVAGCTSPRTAVEAKITKIDSSDQTVVLCSAKTVTITAPVSGLNYLWSPNGEISESITVATTGNYVVNISSPIATSCDSKKTYTVIERPAPEISNIEINENSIRILLTDPQDYYEFSIDSELFQNSNQFNFISSGTKTVYVRDDNSCDLVSKPFTIFSISKYFTPNNDGFNDTWLIPEMKDYPGSNVKIFNRFGKLLKQMNAGTVGWTGKFNNQDLPADDYWYVLKLDPTQPEIRGHFTLKR